MNYLSQIKCPNDIKKFDIGELGQLADEIREFLVESLAKTGGHLSSNMGVVELTIALTYCFDFEEDKIIWDVGHQSYVYKMLTGRKGEFKTLRKKDGLSGFPKVKESKYDHFGTGHSSTSVSAGLGFATGRDLDGKKFNVISVIGDGAMTGGLVYEALNNTGANNKRLIIILNDNQMSISENVGSMSKYLSSLRSTPKYLEAKGDIKKFLKKFEYGEKINKIIEKTKQGIKHVLLPSIMFEELGIKYIGAIDGHNMGELIKTFNNIKNINQPIILHMITKKGNGYLPAEKNSGSFHSIAPFDIDTGEVLKEKSKIYSDIFGQYMVRNANKNKKLVAITASMLDGTGLRVFKKLYPNKIFDVGIAEEHAVVFAGGLAMGGYTPVVAIYSTFLQRSYDQILHDICIQNLHVIFCIDRAGVVGEDGETHQGIYDLSYLSHIPNLAVLSPKNKTEFVQMLDFAVYKYKSPIAIRYPKAYANDTYEENTKEICYGESEIIKKGGNIAIVTVGPIIKNVKGVYERLTQNGYDVALINARFVSPICKNLIKDIKEKYEYVFTVEDNIEKGGYGANLVLELVKEEIFDKKIYIISLPNKYIEQGSISEIYMKYGLDENGIYNKIINKITKKY